MFLCATQPTYLHLNIWKKCRKTIYSKDVKIPRELAPVRRTGKAVSPIDFRDRFHRPIFRFLASTYKLSVYGHKFSALVCFPGMGTSSKKVKKKKKAAERWWINKRRWVGSADCQIRSERPREGDFPSFN
jgi:hypothetical protein